MKAILEKLHAVMKDVDRIHKDSYNKHQKYNYASEKAIKEVLHQQFVDKGIIFTMSTSNPRIEGGVTYIDCNYMFTDIESSDVLKGTFLGSGQSRDEKGHYAAITGAIKYILTTTFLIPTGDDPENNRNEPPKDTRGNPIPADPGKEVRNEIAKGSDRIKAVPPANGYDKVTETQAKLICITAKKKTMTDDDRHTLTVRVCGKGVTSSKDVPAAKVNDMLEAIKGWSPTDTAKQEPADDLPFDNQF